MKLNEILKASSLAGSLSDMEIDELVEEIKLDFDELVDELVENETDAHKEEKDDLKDYCDELERKLENVNLPMKTLNDSMVIEWVSNNWETVSRIESMNLDGKGIERLLMHGELASKLKEHLFVVEGAKRFTEQEKEREAEHVRIVLVGKAAGGKDHARKLFENRNFSYAVSYTTRPPRVGEENGKDYYFLSVEEFEKMIVEDKFYEYVSFNGWYYGTSNKQFYQDDIFIMTPYGVSQIHSEDRKKTMVIYFDMPLEIRKERLEKRSDADKVERRLLADELDFQNFTDYDLKITDPNF